MLISASKWVSRERVPLRRDPFLSFLLLASLSFWCIVTRNFFFFFLRNLWKEGRRRVEKEEGRKRRASLGRLEGGRVNGEEDSSIAVVDKIVKGV